MYKSQQMSGQGTNRHSATCTNEPAGSSQGGPSTTEEIIGHSGRNPSDGKGLERESRAVGAAEAEILRPEQAWHAQGTCRLSGGEPRVIPESGADSKPPPKPP